MLLLLRSKVIGMTHFLRFHFDENTPPYFMGPLIYPGTDREAYLAMLGWVLWAMTQNRQSSITNSWLVSNSAGHTFAVLLNR